MRQSARRITVSALGSFVILCVACGNTPPVIPTAEETSVSETMTMPPIQVTVHAAETANAMAFGAETVAAMVARQTPPALAPTPVPPSPSPPPTQTPVPPTPTLGTGSGAYTAAYPLVSVVDLAQQPERYENVRFSVIGYAYDVHARKGTTTFFLASDDRRSNSIFVSLEGVDSRVQENAPLQVYGTGAKTIRVVINGDMESENPFMQAVLIRPAR